MVSQGSRFKDFGMWDMGVRMWDVGCGMWDVEVGILGMGFGGWMDYGVSSN